MASTAQVIKTKAALNDEDGCFTNFTIDPTRIHDLLLFVLPGIAYGISCFLSGLSQFTAAIMKGGRFQVTLNIGRYEAFLHKEVNLVTFRDTQ
ncbi:MAG: hypothetical protein NDI77_04765 [Geobacteraceae bacterium]|nr:hypothetical protein [Geobacteraceae bacterium]